MSVPLTLTDPAGAPAGPSLADLVEASLSRRWKVPVRRGTAVPALLRDLLRDLAGPAPVDVLLSARGLGRGHGAADRRRPEPRQLDLWRIRAGGEVLGLLDVMEMIDLVVASVLPGHRWLAEPARHPYTRAGRRVTVEAGGTTSEIGNCGLARPEVLRAWGLPPASSALVLGLQVDRLAGLVTGAAAGPPPPGS